MNKYHIISIILFFTLGGYAQNQVDVLRYSQYQIGGTARSISYGGAMGTLGSDFSALTINPAGIGLFRKSVISISPTFYFSKLNTSMGEYNTDGIKDNFNLNQYGVVFAKKLDGNSGWKFFQFGFGVNRQNNYNSYYHIKNDNKNTSLMTDYISKANGNYVSELDNFSTGLAWDNFLLDTASTGDTYSSVIENGGVQQELKKTTWGSINEMTINMGSSYDDIFYIGGSIGFPFVRYFEETEYIESDVMDTIYDFEKFVLDERLETHGSGLNFKIGMIIRPTGFLRLGFAFHSPTWYNMNDEWFSKITSYWNNGTKPDKYASASPVGKYNYDISTPMKVNAGATFTLARVFLLSAEADYINYSSGRLKARDYNFFDENAEVRDLYRPVVNIRAGAELRLRPLSFRIGIQHYPSPYKDDNINDSKLWVAGAGFGYRTRDLFLDIAYSYSIKKEQYYMYDSNLIGATDLVFNENRIVVTAGYKF